ncbi:MAG TPA: sigma factor, partial [Mucilaginibacter sp.]
MAPLQNIPDQELIARLGQGDRRAFTEIYKRYWERLFVVANNRLGNSEEAEEVVQDVFFSLWKRRETLQIEHAL